MTDYHRVIDVQNLWASIQAEAREAASNYPLLADFFTRNLLQHATFERALAWVLAEKLTDHAADIAGWQQQILELMNEQSAICQAAQKDLLCQLESNACIKDHYTPLLHFSSYQALQCHRLAHHCWNSDRRPLASYIQGRVVSQFGVDIHPGASIGAGIFMDHSVGVVIGETAVIEDDVTLFQNVTLGGTGKGSGDRHPKVRQGAFIGSGAVVFGNIEIGPGAKVAGGAAVVKPVAAGQTVIGPAARPLANK